MRVLQLIGSTGFYGAETVVATLARSLPEVGIETCVGHIRYSRNAGLRLETCLPDCETFAVEHRSRFDLAGLKQLCSDIRHRDIRAIHSHGYKPDVYGWIAARLAGIPIISTCHLWTKATPALKAYARMDALLLRRFERVVGVSDPIVRELRDAGVPERKLIMIPNGVAVATFIAVKPSYRSIFDDKAFVFGTACRQVPAKGVDLLLRAIQRVVALSPLVRVLVAGDGPKLDEYRELSRHLGLNEKVIFLGRCNSMPEFYASLDSFILPSLDEGLPMALLEAMASGRMVIATDVGSVGKVVRDQENGLLIPPGSIDALTAAMLSVASNRERLPRFGASARSEMFAHFSSHRMVSRYADIYKEALSE